MKLSLFTPGAYIWPIHRNFEAFIAALGDAGDEPAAVAHHNYPAELERLDKRLTSLHREVYDALLRPSEFFENETAFMDEYFWPDLRHTAVDNLLGIFMYYFAGQPASQLAVPAGLNVLRSVFFNHEASEPQHWVHTSLARLAYLRPVLRMHTVSFTAPRTARLDDMAFGISADPLRPPAGTAWITGRARRTLDGLCQVRAECIVDPSLGEAELPEHVSATMDEEIRTSIADAFGWPAEVSA